MNRLNEIDARIKEIRQRKQELVGNLDNEYFKLVGEKNTIIAEERVTAKRLRQKRSNYKNWEMEFTWNNGLRFNTENKSKSDIMELIFTYGLPENVNVSKIY